MTGWKWRCLVALTWLAFTLIVVKCVPWPAHAQAMKPHPPATAPDPYIGKYNFNGTNCCNGHDCQQAIDGTDFKPVAGGYLIKPTGEVIEIGRTGFSPDAFWHVCRRDDVPKTVRCLLVPAGGS